MKINIKVTGVQNVERRFKNIGKAVDDMRKPFDEITREWSETFDKNFPATGSALNQPWPPRKRLYAWPILQKTGKLRKGFNRKIEKKEAEIENKVKYAKYHQFGTTFLPVRRVIDVTDRMAKFAVNVIRDYINFAIRK